MKPSLWWVSESSHVWVHATRSWHPNRECDDGDLLWFRTKSRNLVGKLFARMCLVVSTLILPSLKNMPWRVWWIPPGEKTPAPSQPGRVHRTQKTTWVFFQIILIKMRLEGWPNSCEADSPSELCKDHSLNLSSQMRLERLLSKSNITK